MTAPLPGWQIMRCRWPWHPPGVLRGAVRCLPCCWEPGGAPSLNTLTAAQKRAVAVGAYGRRVKI